MEHTGRKNGSIWGYGLDLLDVGVVRREIRWEFIANHPELERAVHLVVHTSDRGVLFDVQQTGCLVGAEVALPFGILETLAVQVRQELARSRLGHLVARLDRQRRRW